MIKTNIKLRVTPKQSEAVQLICFANNISWSNEFELNFLDSPCLFIDHRWLSYSHNIKFYNEQEEEEADADLFIRTNGTCEESIDIVNNSSNNKSKEDIFKQYGFEVPDFECELWQVETSTSFEYVHGLVLNKYAHPMGNLEYHKWNKKTGEVLVGCSSKSLTPIKKPWYETCKFPCIIMADYCMPVVVKHYDDGYVYDFRDNKYCVKSWRLLANNEIEGLKQ